MSLPEKCRHGVESFHKDRLGPYVVAAGCADCRRFSVELAAIYNADLAEEAEQIPRLVKALAVAFPSFGNGQTGGDQPLVNWMKEPIFGKGVPIEAVVRFVLERVWRREDRPEIPWSEEVHRERHVLLHRSLDELLADWITHTGKTPSGDTVMEFLQWSHLQTEHPTPNPGNPISESEYIERHPEMLER